MKGPRFEVYRSRDGWRWRLRARNGRVIATGESHTRERDALRAAMSDLDSESAYRRRVVEHAHEIRRLAIDHGIPADELPPFPPRTP